MAPAPKLKSRYEIKERLPKQGAMGVVYKAWDLELKRFVAIKTIGDARNRTAVDHFRQECGVLASINHANIVDIYDIGEMEDAGHQKPFFVMPFLPGQTLEQLMSGQALNTDRAVEIICQVCRGLQAAHERGVVHRDLKPSNIFVDDGGSVKIIDFGIAHLVDNSASIGLKGTLLYMSPEQIQLKPLTAPSDIFSLAVVTYEALTGRRPFDGATQEEIAYRILHHVPPPASDLNPAVSSTLSQVIHAAMAKQGRHRFPSASDFADALQKALHNRAIDRFDPKRVEPRIRKAQQALSESQYEFASDLVSELESEGHLHSEIRVLRGQIDQALRERGFREHLTNARRFFDAEEYPLAMQKIQAVLDQQPDHPEARALSFQVEEKWNAQQRAEWLRLAREHMENQSFPQARQALDNALKLGPTDTQALQLLSTVSRSEEHFLRARRESAELFQAARDAFARGEISSALYKAEQVVEQDRLMPDKASPDLGQAHLSFYNQVRSEHHSLRSGLDEGNRLLANQDFQAALSLCDSFLARYPQDPQFRALRIDIDQKQRQQLSALIARIDRDLDSEPDLNRRVTILEQALKQWPREEHFKRALQAAVDKRDLVQSIAKKALNLEERGQFSEAISQWETLRTIYPGYPGLDLEIDRVAKRREQQARADAKTRLLAQVERLLELGNYSDAIQAAEAALNDFRGDAELTAVAEAARDRRRKADEACLLLEEGQRLFSRGQQEEGLERLGQAFELDKRSMVIRAVLVDSMVKRATALQESDLAQASVLLRNALELDPSNAAARNLRTLLSDRQRQSEVGNSLARARSLREQGDRQAARQEVATTLSTYPGEPRLTQFLSGIDKEIEEAATALLPPPAPPVSPLSAGQASGPPQSPAPLRIGPKHWFLGVAFGLLASLLLGALLWWTPSTPGVEPSAPAAVALSVETSPAARIFLDGNPVEGNTIHLAPRDQPYSIDARLAGYRNALPASVTVTKSTRTLDPIRLVLEPLPTSLLIVSAMNARLNGQPVALTEPVVLAPGSHKIELLAATGSALSFDVDAQAGRLPVISNLTAKMLTLASVVTTFGSEGRIYVRPAPQIVALDGGESKTVPEEGLSLQNLAPADHTLVFGSANPQVIAVSDAPAIFVHSSAGEIETGFLTLAIPQEGAKVLLQGPVTRQAQVKGGRVSMSGLKPGEYSLAISAEGHQPLSDKITIEKGKQAARQYQLTPVERPTGLSLAGLPAGAEVMINDQPAGTASAEGTLSLPSIGPGRKTIVLRHPRHETKTFVQDLSVGDNLQLGPDRTRMAAFGSIRISNAPAGSRISYRQKGGSGPYQEAKENPFYVRQGEYDVLIRADRFQDGHVPITVYPGKPSESAVNLAAIAAPAPQPVAVRLTIEDFEGKVNADKNGWRIANNAKLKRTLEAGTLQFAAQLRGWPRKDAKWSLRSASGGQCTEFELTSKQFGSGPCTREAKKMKDHGLGEAQSYRVVIQLLPGGVTHQIAPADTGAAKQVDSRPAPAGGSEFRLVDLGVRNFDFNGQVK